MSLTTAKEGKSLDARKDNFGIRRVRVVEDKLEDQEGRTFLFEVNNIRVRASHCVSRKEFPPFPLSVTPERYRAWLQLMVDGNQNMVRIFLRVAAATHACPQSWASSCGRTLCSG